VPKSFPVCTIRSTPSQPIHCIVWAKSYLFTQLFGVDEEEVPEVDHTSDASNGVAIPPQHLILAEEIASLKKEAEALKTIKNAMGQENFASLVFEKVFKTDIQRLLSMSDMWKSRTPPKPLRYSDFTLPSALEILKIANDDQRVWDLTANIAVFKHSIDRLCKRWKTIQQPNSVQVLTFDKDDVDTLDFVSATANIRSTIFSIQTKSKFDIKRTFPA
jgi:ubiquitin-like 1-activating enzyme E1 B